MEIEFFAATKVVKTLLPPIPAAQAIPEWWVKAQRTVEGSGDPAIGKTDSQTFKACQPFTDTLRTGYIIPLWQDIAYSDTSEYYGESEPRITINWGRGGPVNGTSAPPIETKGWESWEEIAGVGGNLIYGASFSFSNPWVIRTPPGYSCLFTEPLNNENSAIRLFSGIVNTDTYFNNVNFFFGFRKGISTPGILKRGMPLIQVIPFKREEWTYSVNPIEVDGEEYNNRESVINELSSHLTGGYKIHHGCPIKFK
jgi:hypothetical protein